MSNESKNKNKRIDLTQFEGMTEGPWESEEWLEGKILGPKLERHGNGHPIVAVVGDGWWGNSMPECNANKRAMTAAPELIAELKRCYEEINLAHRNLSIVRNALARGYPDIEEEIWELIDASE